MDLKQAKDSAIALLHEKEMLITINPDEPLTKEQEQLFRNIVDHKERSTENNIIEAKNQRGPSRKLLLIRMPRLPSDICASSTARRRSKSFENFELINSSTGLNESALNHQRSLVVKRNKSEYSAVCRQVGTLSKGVISMVSMKVMKSQLPWKMLR